jgi:hypothetical protein
MAPGYAQDRRPDFDRPITPECLFCHASRALAEPGTLNRMVNLNDLRGVGCERCHGDGAAHSAAPRRDNIVNPARLQGSLRSAVCEQCHLAGEARVALPGKAATEFRPGEELSDYVDVFIARAAAGVRVNGHAEALARSRCAGSGKLWCGSCHNPHQPVASYREKCLACHAASDCPSPDRNDGGCNRCHMPRERAYDGGHTMFTDHSIPRRRPRRAEAVRGRVVELAPYFERRLAESVASRNLGMAYAAVGNVEKAWPLLRAAAQSGPRDAALTARVAIFLHADGRREQAAELFRMALEMDATQDPAPLGLLLAQRGARAEARRLLEKALIRNPRQPDVRKALEALR